MFSCNFIYPLLRDRALCANVNGDHGTLPGTSLIIKKTNWFKDKKILLQRHA